jgi:hypothetical protein
MSGDRRMDISAAVAPAVLKPTPLPKPPIRTLITVALALALLVMSWAIAPIKNKGGPAPCNPPGSACE